MTGREGREIRLINYVYPAAVKSLAIFSLNLVTIFFADESLTIRKHVRNWMMDNLYMRAYIYHVYIAVISDAGRKVTVDSK